MRSESVHCIAKFALPFARQEDHLIGQPRDALHATRHRDAERFLKLGVTDRLA